MYKFLILVPILAQGIWQVTHADAMEVGWMKSTYELRAKLESVGFDKPLATALINRCKATARDPRHCVITGAFIAKAESGAGQAVTKCNNVFGMTGGCYESRTTSIDEWVTKYDRWWYRRPNPNHFYSDTPKRKPETRYCMSEYSSNSEGFCPNGHRHAWNAYNLLIK